MPRRRHRPRRHHLAAWLAAALLAAPAGAQELRRIAVYDPADARPDLQVAVWETRASGAYPLADLHRRLAAVTPAETAVALAYLDAVRRGRLDRLGELHAGSGLAEARQAAQLYRRFLKGLPGDAESVHLERTWHFGPYRVVVLRLASAEDATRIVTVSLEAVEDRFVRRDHWGTWQPVHELFWYLAGTLNAPPQARAAGRPDPHPLSDSVSLTSGGTARGLRVELDGVRYAAEAAEPAASPATIRGFVHRALAVAEGGDDGAFVDLWDDEGRQRLSAAMTGNRPIFNGVRATLRGLGTVRDRLTLPLGDFAMHYFSSEAEPRELRAVVVRQQAGRYGLSDRLPHNLRSLLDSELFRQALQEQILGSGG